ncbi:SidA/IucD/PvdA family monooxygenase [Stenoxybacter acetivorans]|uniref:SidA/IucD/PvdA family monooxygenase n=1 Tax=Stenoxybacter acetivorans TaxID=422441 RepID=UPI00055D5C27|nr:SidA/IucD/PvdA family monooxygenase [Stenoxybacter acetivorans]
MKENIYDIIGIGFGPANIALAIALEELAPNYSVLFMEQRDNALWQPGMLLEDSDIQNHPLRDLVTPRNPRSRYTFTNFLHEHNRLYEHLNLPLHYPLRIEYAQYVIWVANHFHEQVKYQCKVTDIQLIEHNDGKLCYKVFCLNNEEYYARSIVLAPGRTPNIPEPFNQFSDNRIIHLTNYLPTLEQLPIEKQNRIAVIGGSQSAVEILLHACSQSKLNYICGITRNFAYRQKDTSPFSDEVYFPSFADTFFHAQQEIKRKLRDELIFTNYSSADIDVINQLYIKNYSYRLQKINRLELLTCTEILDCIPSQESITIKLKNIISKKIVERNVDLVVLATGFLDLGQGVKKETYPKILEKLSHFLEYENGIIKISRDYQVCLNIPNNFKTPLYLNGLCESSHGMGDAGSFSLLALRSEQIVNSIINIL